MLRAVCPNLNTCLVLSIPGTEDDCGKEELYWHAEEKGSEPLNYREYGKIFERMESKVQTSYHVSPFPYFAS